MSKVVSFGERGQIESHLGFVPTDRTVGRKDGGSDGQTAAKNEKTFKYTKKHAKTAKLNK